MLEPEHIQVVSFLPVLTLSPREAILNPECRTPSFSLSERGFWWERGYLRMDADGDSYVILPTFSQGWTEDWSLLTRHYWGHDISPKSWCYTLSHSSPGSVLVKLRVLQILVIHQRSDVLTSYGYGFFFKLMSRVRVIYLLLRKKINCSIPTLNKEHTAFVN